MQRHIKILGGYLIASALFHLGIYFALAASQDKYINLFYLDTRIPLFFIETILRGAEGNAPALSAWFVELGMFVLGVAMFLGRELHKLYTLLESALALPFLLFLFFIFAADLSPSHGFSVRELLLPSISFVVCSLIPLVYAFWIRWYFRYKGGLSIR